MPTYRNSLLLAHLPGAAVGSGEYCFKEEVQNCCIVTQGEISIENVGAFFQDCCFFIFKLS